MNSAGNNSVTYKVISEEEQGQRLDNFLIRHCKDEQLAIEPNGSNGRTIPKSSLLKGMYKARIKWKNGGKEFYKEESVFVE